MASKSIKVPKLEISEVDELNSWNKFIKRFEIAAISVQWAEKAKVAEGEGAEVINEERKEERDRLMEHRKGAELLNTIGEEGMEIFEGFNIEVEDIEYRDLKRRFATYFGARENKIILRHRFLCTEQTNGEKVTDFILRVGRRADQCQLAALREDLVVQVAIKGMHEERLRHQLLREAELTLEKLKTISMAHESANRTVKELNKETKRGGEEKGVQRHTPEESEGEIDAITQHKHIQGGAGERTGENTDRTHML